jgi:hypothetical protein
MGQPEYKPASMAEKAKRGVWTYERGMGRRRSRIYARCCACGTINDMTPIGFMVVYEHEKPVWGETIQCWDCRGCLGSFTGHVFHGLGLVHQNSRTPFAPNYAEFDRLFGSVGTNSRASIVSVRVESRGAKGASLVVRRGGRYYVISRLTRRSPYVVHTRLSGNIEFNTPAEAVQRVMELFSADEETAKAAKAAKAAQ